MSNVVSKLTQEELSRLTKEEWINMGKSKKQRSRKSREKVILKLNNEKMEKQIIHLKKELYTTIKKKIKKSTIDTKFDKFGNKVPLLKTSNGVDE